MAVPVFQALGAQTAGVSSLSVTWPTHAIDDVALMFVESANETIGLTGGAEAGFVELASGSPQGTGTAAGLTATRLAVYWCRATSSAMGNPGVADSGDHTAARIITFRGCIASGNPWDIIAGDVEATTTTAVAIPGGTTTVDECLIVGSLANATDVANTGGNIGATYVNTGLTSITKQADTNHTQGNGGGIQVVTGVKAVAGLFGTTTNTLTTASVQGRIMVALKPPSPSAVPVRSIRQAIMRASVY